MALQAFPAAASDAVSAYAPDASTPDMSAIGAGGDMVWPDVEWVAETENFLQVRFREAAKNFAAEWGNLPQERLSPGSILRPGAAGARVDAVRRRLGLRETGIFDETLAGKISAYRAAHDLPIGRHIDDPLIRSLNLGFAHYSRQIDLNLQRLRQLPGRLGSRFVLVDSAAQQLFMFDGEQIAGSMKVVVGKPSDQTPSLMGKIDRVVLNPYWNVPPDLTQTRYAPRILSGGERYLETRGFEALSDWSDTAQILRHDAVDWRSVASGQQELRLRQRPGPGNGMGTIKFMFPNQHGVYLHDTPSKGLFGKAIRAFSAGCVRLEKPWQLADWLFGHRPATHSSQPEQSVNLPDTVPIYIVYLTAMPSTDGFDFRSDIYGRDTP
ncbi:L,D-transpeptidase family protein [Pontixanthobacter sp.]|uniref:L,D-transpeptidase family protein n=1 Tax=Pontixanthobacter sp. TaxID=2792078 RepID=UPI003C7A10D6